MNDILRFVSLILGATVVLTAAACQKNAPNKHASEVEAVRAADRELQQAITAKDVERAVSFYAADASLLPIAEPIVIGKDAIRKEWAHLFAIPNFNMTSNLTKAEVSSDGDLAYTQGTYEAAMDGLNGKSVTERGKWVSIWKKQSDGSWKIIVDVSNTDAPPPDHAASTVKESAPR